jgi:hypothetical protein
VRYLLLVLPLGVGALASLYARRRGRGPLSVWRWAAAGALLCAAVIALAGLVLLLIAVGTSDWGGWDPYRSP